MLVATVPSTDQVRIRSILQLIVSISGVLQKLLRCFIGAIIVTSFVTLLFVWPNTFSSNLNEAVSLLAKRSIILATLFEACSSI